MRWVKGASALNPNFVDYRCIACSHKDVAVDEGKLRITADWIKVCRIASICKSIKNCYFVLI